MMHGHEKSRSAIVAVKPTNKAERSAAELVERRAETKGNVDQQRTGRTQRRLSVSQMLERIRRGAKERKKEKFTSLLHQIGRALHAEQFTSTRWLMSARSSIISTGRIFRDFGTQTVCAPGDRAARLSPDCRSNPG